MAELPSHLKRYVVTQEYSRYTPIEHSIWRYLLRQLRAYLSVHAHPSYLDGLEKTGITIDRIPKISDISAHLERFGWKAVPVSGFIPPAAFMELQSLGYLPIASDMRTLEHMMYTPAPDIVHEAAGHAPILAEPRFAAYLQEYAQVSRKAIISKDDMAQYDAIRLLSDLKEHPDTTPQQVQEAENRLAEITKNISYLSEAALLSRMNWWTAEYGLIGTLENPKIFGAGLLSSVGEARSCLSEKVKKIPLTVECIEYSYDITEPQPQLFVTPDFEHLSVVLEDLAKTMAYRTGGISGLEKARKAETANTVELDSGIQISGVLANWIRAEKGLHEPEQSIAYLQFQGPTQLAYDGKELLGHGVSYHSQGFGSPVGYLKGHADKSLADFSDSDLRGVGIENDKNCRLEFESGVTVVGRLTGSTRSPKGKLLILTFSNCTVTLGEKSLFLPAWGTFDMAVGAKVTSVFGGPADRETYGETEDFETRRVPQKVYPPEMLRLFNAYEKLSEIRNSKESTSERLHALEDILNKIETYYPNEWLLRLEVLEIAEQMSPPPPWKAKVRQDLETMAAYDAKAQTAIADGLKLIAVP